MSERINEESEGSAKESKAKKSESAAKKSEGSAKELKAKKSEGSAKELKAKKSESAAKKSEGSAKELKAKKSESASSGSVKEESAKLEAKSAQLSSKTKTAPPAVSKKEKIEAKPSVEDTEAKKASQVKASQVKASVKGEDLKKEGAEIDGVKDKGPQTIKLNGLYLFKKSMSSVYNEKGVAIPVTVLKYQPNLVSQVKTEERDGYQAVQVACSPRRKSSAAERGHLKLSGMENGACVIKEIRQSLPEGINVGQRVEIESLEKGDRVNVIGYSKGRGFSGVVKRWGFRGGPASHGSGFHRRPGSIGNCEDPGRVMPGRKMPGHFGVDRVTVPKTSVVDVIPDENVVLVKGPVPGAFNSLVQVMKV